MNTLRLIRIVALVGILRWTAVEAAVSLPEVFSDHMVLQQGQINPIWGWASPNETVVIEIGDQRHTVVADERGQWRAELEPLRVGGPYILEVRGPNLLRIEDVLVGEVWFTSGQSNMRFPVSATTSAAETIASSRCEDIRFFQVAQHSALEPVDHNPSKWRVCSASTVGGFSAVAYFFGKRLQEALGVPVGLIDASWGGTSAEEWTRRDELDSDPMFRAILERWERAGASARHFFTGDLQVEIELDDLVFLPKDSREPPLILDDFEDGDFVTRLFGRWLAPDPRPWGHRSLTVREGEDGSLRLVSRFRPGGAVQARVDYGPGRYVDLSRYGAIRFRCRGYGHLKFHSLQPDVDDWDNFAAGLIHLTPEWRTHTIRFEDLSQAGWGKRRTFTPTRLSGAVFEVQPAEELPRPPSGLFNGMVHPIVPFGLRGAVWYQGEGNAGRAYQYRSLLPALIRSWRSAWMKPRLPFLVVQLPGYGTRASEPGESSWAELREAQLAAALNDDRVGLAVTVDLGEDDDVHPREKREVGRRLALLALGEVFGEDIVSSGPLFRSARRVGNSIRVEFAHTGGGLVGLGGAPLTGFVIAGEDRRFVRADTRIEDAAVIVSSAAVPNPVAVRYAWADNPEHSLYNADGLPASPFRTDDWPGVTVDRR
jgi:sialate O-acetylesterase